MNVNMKERPPTFVLRPHNPLGDKPRAKKKKKRCRKNGCTALISALPLAPLGGREGRRAGGSLQVQGPGRRHWKRQGDSHRGASGTASLAPRLAPCRHFPTRTQFTRGSFHSPRPTRCARPVPEMAIEITHATPTHPRLRVPRHATLRVPSRPARAWPP